MCRACLEPVVTMTYGKNGATCWLAGAVRTFQKRVEMLEAKDSFKNVECSIHEIQDTSPEVRVPRHKPAGDLEHGGVISGIRMPRPEGAAERVIQFSLVRGCQQLTDEILQCGFVEDKINMFEKIGEGDSDRAALRVRCRSRSQTSEALQDPFQLRQNPNLPRFRSVVVRKCNWRPHASFGTYTLPFETVGLSFLCG